MASFPQASPPTPCAPLYPPPYGPHALPISFLLILPPAQYWVRSTVQLLIMQLSPFACHLVPLRSKYSPQHPILKHPQPAFLPQTTLHEAANNIQLLVSKCCTWNTDHFWSFKVQDIQLALKRMLVEDTALDVTDDWVRGIFMSRLRHTLLLFRVKQERYSWQQTDKINSWPSAVHTGW